MFLRKQRRKKLKKKIRTTSFWLGLCGAVVLILETISNIFNLNLHSKEVESIILAICSALVMLGIITKKDISDEKDLSSKELLEDINKESKDENE